MAVMLMKPETHEMSLHCKVEQLAESVERRR
jgi:hypothetical protein